MARLAVSLQAGVCLLALLACAACAAAADSDAGKQSTATAGAQQYGGDEHEHYGESDHDNYQHKRTEATLYLQETSQQVIDSATVFARHTFSCAKESDAADVCLQPPHYGGYDEHKQYDDADDLLSGLPFNNDAAVCQTAFLRGSCPASIPAEAGCEILQINCTIGKQAAECGCPYADGFSFTSVGYLVYVNNATSCFPPAEEPPIRAKRAVKTASYYPPANNATIYNGTADVAVAHIDYLVSSYGYKEVKGKLEFVVDFVEAEYINMRKSGAKKTAKTAYNHYEGEHSDDDEGEHSYHAEAPYYYSHEDRYYEGAHRGRSDYSSSRHPRNLVKKGNLKITLLEKQYY